VRDRPVHLRNLRSALSAQALPVVVNVGVRGSRETLQKLDPDDISAYVDLAGLGSGLYTLTVRADSSGEAGVTRVEPPTVQVRVSSGK